jgi:hypothetical protein
MEPSTTFNLNGYSYTRNQSGQNKKNGLKTWYYKCTQYRSRQCNGKLTVKEELDGNHVYVVSTEHNNCFPPTTLPQIVDITKIEKDFIAEAALKTLSKRGELIEIEVNKSEKMVAAVVV